MASSERHEPGFVHFAFADVNGVLRGKAYTHAAFASICRTGHTAMTDLLLAVDPVDEPITTFPALGINGGARDLWLRPVPDARWDVPWSPGDAIAFGDLETDAGAPCELVPRRVLANAEARLERLGLTTLAAFEYEVRFAAAEDGAPATPGRSYSIRGIAQPAEFVHELEAACAHLDLGLSAVHTEAGPGLIEINVDARPALQAADRAMLLRHALAEIARQHGLTVNLLAKPVAGAEGSSGHVHLSLWRDGRNVMAPDADGRPSTILAQSIAGVLEHLPAASLCMNPNLNSYKRLVPGFFAPVNRSWGLDNRSAAVRAISVADARFARFEVRRPGVDANPYLALAAILVSAALGIEQGLEPPDPSVGDISEASGIDALPSSLESALSAFRADAVFRDALGSAFSEYFAITREWELRAWQHAVTTWELERYGTP